MKRLRVPTGRFPRDIGGRHVGTMEAPATVLQFAQLVDSVAFGDWIALVIIGVPLAS